MNKTLFTLIALSIICKIGHAEQHFQSHEAIYRAVKNTIANKITPSVDYTTSVIPLDSQLQLPECTKPLEVFIPIDVIKAGRTSIAVRCNAEKKWSIFVSARVNVYQHILILSQPVQRGDVITRSMFFSERRDVSKLREDFFTQAGQVENKQATRPLATGSILSIRNVSEPLIVKKGDKVVISSTSTSFAISMSGLAMMDGVKGQRIRVKNENSGRVINGTVIETGLVAVK